MFPAWPPGHRLGMRRKRIPRLRSSIKCSRSLRADSLPNMNRYLTTQPTSNPYLRTTVLVPLLIIAKKRSAHACTAFDCCRRRSATAVDRYRRRRSARACAAVDRHGRRRGEVR
ncbi:hypothetical protein WN943_006268 [Citrus x changshan-huyou]